jgi:hypothetical protein
MSAYKLFITHMATNYSTQHTDDIRLGLAHMATVLELNFDELIYN